MFCKNCGREVDVKAAFCPGCGCRMENEIVTMTKTVDQGGFMSKAEQDNQFFIQAMGSLLAPLEQIGKVVTTIDNNKKAIKKAQSGLRNHVSLWLPALITGIVALYIGSLFGSMKAVGVLWLIGIPTAGVIGFVRERNYKITMEKLVPMQDDLLLQLNDICGTINPEYMHLIPRDYRYFQACQFFYTAFVNGRAMNMQQVVNLYEEEMHRNRMENMQLKQVEQLKSIRTSSNISAAASTANLFINLFG